MNARHPIGSAAECSIEAPLPGGSYRKTRISRLLQIRSHREPHLANQLYADLTRSGVETLIGDRDPEMTGGKELDKIVEADGVGALTLTTVADAEGKPMRCNRRRGQRSARRAL